MTHPKEPLPDSAYRRLPKRSRTGRGCASAAPRSTRSSAGKGYAIFIDVNSHDELIDILHKNPMVQDEETEVFRWGRSGASS